jgi:acetyl-CoA carboxylase beta subunit
LAVVEYIAGNTQKGCDYAERSQKLNLSSKDSERTVAICAIMQNKSSLTARQQTNLLLDAHMYRLALTRLEATDPKANDDWQSIAKIYANTGQLDKAVAALDGGLAQSPSNQALLELKVRYLLAQGKDAEAKPLQIQLNQMKFTKFQ